MADTRVVLLHDELAKPHGDGATNDMEVRQCSARRRRRLGLLLVVATISLPFIILAARLIMFGRAYFPFFDHAWLELEVRDVGSHPPLVGSYSRFGFFHPGPALFWCLALPYRLFGSVGLSVGALALNAASIAGS